MMSKERELLKRSVRIIESLGPDDEAYNLIDKIEELLAQPEQPPITQCEMYQRGYAKAELDLKREPLSDEAIWQALSSEQIPDYKAMTFIKGVRFAEREHGIGE